MRIASFDIGRINFAAFVIDVDDSVISQCRSYADCVQCVSSHTETELVHWSNTGIQPAGATSIGGLVQALAAHIAKQWQDLWSSVDFVVIEQQLLRNPSMKCAAHSLQAIFAFHGKQVVLMPARSKFRGFPGRMLGTERSPKLKQLSVVLIQEWAVAYQGRVAPGSCEALACVIAGKCKSKTAPKLDDLCDAALQGLSSVYYCRSHRSHRDCSNSSCPSAAAEADQAER